MALPRRFIHTLLATLINHSHWSTTQMNIESLPVLYSNGMPSFKEFPITAVAHHHRSYWLIFPPESSRLALHTAQKLTLELRHHLGTVLTFGTGSTGDTYVRLVDKDGKQLAYDDRRLLRNGRRLAAPPLHTRHTITFKVGWCLSTTSTCSAAVTVTGISSVSYSPTVSPSFNPTAPAPSPSSIAPTAAATPTSQFPVTVNGWYRYDVSIDLSSATSITTCPKDWTPSWTMMCCQ